MSEHNSRTGVGGTHPLGQRPVSGARTGWCSAKTRPSLLAFHVELRLGFDSRVHRQPVRSKGVTGIKTLPMGPEQTGEKLERDTLSRRLKSRLCGTRPFPATLSAAPARPPSPSAWRA